MLVRNIIYSFTQSFESFPVLFRSFQMCNFRVLPATEFSLFRANNSIYELLTNVSVAFYRVSVFSLVHSSE